MNIIDELHEACGREYVETGDVKWLNELAEDLNTILGSAQWRLGVYGDDTDIKLARATIRIANRLEEHEELKRK